jgi:hypothetical protein
VIDTPTFLWTVLLVFCCAAWMGWCGGRTYEKAIQVARRMRKRRPLTVNVDYEFAVRAFTAAGYRVEQINQRLH